MEAEQNGATAFDTAVKRKASYHYEGQTILYTQAWPDRPKQFPSFAPEHWTARVFHLERFPATDCVIASGCFTPGPGRGQAPNRGQAPKFSRTLHTLWSIDSQKKISKFDVIRCQILRLKCTKFRFPLGELTDPRPLAVFKGAYF